ncbi:MAG: hypothetical protein ACO1NY_07490 [Pseudorhodoplanes sp.]
MAQPFFAVRRAVRRACPFAFGGWLAICAAAALWAHPVHAQAPQPQAAPGTVAPAPQPQDTPPPPQAQEAPPKRDGFFDAFGKWSRDFKAKVDEANAKWKASVDETNAKLKASADENNAKLKQSVEENNARWRDLQQRNEKAVKEAAAAQKEAAEAFKNLANTRIVEGRQVCEPAANGSPDCQAAAEVICKGKGFSIGKSADITTSRKCSVRSLLQREERDCRTETVVIKAACQ